MPPLSLASPPTDASGQPIIRRLLIANRGEIACRIIATCTKLAITSISVYTEEDRDSLHVSAADEAVCLGSIKRSELNPHQDGHLLINTALSLQADAIHPGYGYLSENASFAEMVKAAGLRFIGPSAHSISVLGDKRQAKEFLMKEAPSVPLIPGYNGKAQDSKSLQAEAERIGFPVLVKAAAGGGGKGMRIVHDPATFEEDLSRAQSEALRSFGSADCLLEKYVAKGKHIEIQIVGDTAGDVISLHERECSIQRRHQKIIEETPSPWISAEMRSSMTAAAITIGQLLSYEGAGTVEFIVEVDSSSFYFLEVNTRIQVEHAITEETTGIDIVALQIYVAAGGLLQDYHKAAKVPQIGHSIECRLCAEDPETGFAPASGLILRWESGADHLRVDERKDVRIETAITTGSNVSVHFDSMIAKIVVWAPDRPSAIARMLRVLRFTQCVGIKTNHSFLQACLSHPKFSDIEYSTNFIPDNLETLLLNAYTVDIAEERRKLSFVPSLLHREMAAASKESSSSRFSTITPGFRNQTFDIGSVSADVVVYNAPGTDEKSVDTSLLVVWPSKSNTARSKQIYQLLTMPQEVGLDDPRGTPKITKSGLSVIAQLFTQCRQMLDVENLETTQDNVLNVIETDWRTLTNAEGHTWTTGELVVEDGGRRSHLWVTCEDKVDYQRILCYDARLGTAVEFQLYTLLAYFKSLRVRLLTASGTDALKQYKSTLPCKVLKVVKNKGDKVAKGDVMVVVESMKMEISISAAVNGVFEPRIAEGSAVDADVLLCEIL